MSAASADKKTLAYELGEQLSQMTDHFLLMTATHATVEVLKPVLMTNRSWDKSKDNASMKHLDEFAALFLNIFHRHRLEHGSSVPISTLSLDDAYAVQRRVIDQRIFQGEKVVGFKVGCTSGAIRHQFGLSEPICGQVMQPHLYFGNAALSSHRFHLPAVEPELVFMIGRDFLDEVGPEEPLANSIEFVSPGIEVHNYDWWFGQPSSQELICSNGLHACLVVGENKIKPQNLDWDMEGVALFKNGELAASGVAAEIMGGPMNSLRWLINHLVRHGGSLRTGQCVIPGSAVRLVPVLSGDRVEARFTHFGSVAAEFNDRAQLEAQS
jgi:2-keto-4-pentenoate hydratase